jgi:predicted MPP superfamily phosphohydrolase
MRYPLIGLVVLLIFIVLVDAWLYLQLKHSAKLNGKTSPNKLTLVLLLSMPLIFIPFFGSLYFLIPNANGPSIYAWFGYGFVVFLSIYSAKVVWLTWQKMFVKPLRVPSANIARKPLVHIDDKVPYPQLSRRKFLSQMGIVISTAPVMGMVFGTLKGRYNFFTRYRKLSFTNLPSAFDGFKIIQISDIHLGSFQSDFEALQEVVDIINGHHPDLIVFTGDLVNNFHQETIGWEQIFTKLKAKHGCYSILGNHDYGYYSKWDTPLAMAQNFEKIVAANKRLGFTLLRNQNVLLERNGDSIAMAGVEYWGTGSHYPNTGDLAKASAGIENAPFKVLLTHDPDHWDAEVVGKTSYDLSLSGHTHGMQFGVDYKGFTWSPAQYKFKRWDGLYQQGNQFLFVNRGLGTLSMPVRLGMSPEITLIELSRGPIGTEPM